MFVGPHGSTEAILINGTMISPLLTWDTKITTVNAILGIYIYLSPSLHLFYFPLLSLSFFILLHICFLPFDPPTLCILLASYTEITTMNMLSTSHTHSPLLLRPPSLLYIFSYIFLSLFLLFCLQEGQRS